MSKSWRRFLSSGGHADEGAERPEGERHRDEVRQRYLDSVPASGQVVAHLVNAEDEHHSHRVGKSRLPRGRLLKQVYPLVDSARECGGHECREEQPEVEKGPRLRHRAKQALFEFLRRDEHIGKPLAVDVQHDLGTPREHLRRDLADVLSDDFWRGAQAPAEHEAGGGDLPTRHLHHRRVDRVPERAKGAQVLR